MQQNKLTDSKYLVWDSQQKIDKENLAKIVTNYLSGSEMDQLQYYDRYYDVENEKIKEKHFSRAQRNITPNEIVPTAYFKTIVDSMAGFMFSNSVYSAGDEFATSALATVLKKNYADIKDMKTGVNALAFNKGVEIVYTKGDGENTPEIRFASVDPRQMIFVYSNDMERELFCGIRIVNSCAEDYDYIIDVFYKDEWAKYFMKGKSITEDTSTELFFSECPVIDYRAEIVNNKSPFHQILRYIDVLDALISGNANDIQKLADAILKLSEQLDEEDAKHLDEIKVLQNLGKDAIAEYITKDMNPAFREHVSKLIIKEIHKHSHTVDWYDAENVNGQASGRSLIIRLYDMMMYSERIEKVYKKGLYKRTKLILETMQKANIIPGYGDISITLNRTLPDNFLDIAPVLNTIQFIDDETKLEMLRLDKETILARLGEQREKNFQELETQMRSSEDDSIDE